MISQSQNTQGLVSIGIPTYDRPEALRRILDVATGQTYVNLEIIVSDNASTTNKVKEVIDEFVKKDSRIKFYQQDTNQGILFNTEFVLSKATGEYFTWFSDDDWRSPEFIETLVHSLQQNPKINFAFCDYHEVYENGDPVLTYPATHLPVFKPFTHSSRLKRVLTYFWQEGQLGKANLFYAVFRRAVLSKLNLKEISENYTLLNLDCLIDFIMLQIGPVIIVPQAMCTLTCGNKKHYLHAQVEKNQVSLIRRMVNVWSMHQQDRSPYIKNTNSIIEKIIIYGMSVFKFARQIIRALNKPRISSTATTPQAQHINNIIHKLSQVTLIAVATREVEETLQALVYSCKNIEFGKVKLLANYTPFELSKYPDIEFSRINKFQSMDDWCRFIIYDLNQYIDTEFMLLVHADGFVVNPQSWREDFLQYDYIGAPWPLPTDGYSYRDLEGNIIRVGNSVSLRSKKLLELPIKLNLPWEPFHGNYHEDGFICVKNRQIYLEHGMKLASIDIAKYFSHEAMIPEIQGLKPFVFHKWAGSNCVYPKFFHMSSL